MFSNPPQEIRKILVPDHPQGPPYDVPFVPTPYEVVDAMLDLGGARSSDILFDLGCGDGRIVIEAAKRFGIRGTGIDIDPIRIEECLVNAAEAKVEELVTFKNQDLFEADFSDATLITLYLLSSVNLRLRPKLLSELKPGTRVVSHDFSMDDWEGDEVLDLMAKEKIHYLYLWIIPANITGSWTLNLASELGGGPKSLDVEQSFQKFTGKSKLGSTDVLVMDGRLKGAEVRFTVTEPGSRGKVWTFTGQAQGHRMEGEVTVAAGERTTKGKWKADRRPATMISLDDGKRPPDLFRFRDDD